MNGYSSRKVLLKTETQTVAGVATNTAVSEVINQSAEDSLRFVVRLNVEAITVVGSVTAKVQESWEADSWVDVGSQANLALTTTGVKEIRMVVDNSTDQAQLPTAPLVRVVISNTHASDTVTIDSLSISRRL